MVIEKEINYYYYYYYNQKQMAHQWPVEMYGQAEKAVQKDITK